MTASDDAERDFTVTLLALVEAADRVADAHYAVVVGIARSQELVADGVDAGIAHTALQKVLASAAAAVNDYRTLRQQVIDSTWR